MFQAIDDVQLQTHDPYYEEIDTEVATSARDPAARENVGLSGAVGASAQAGVLSSLNAGQNMQSQMLPPTDQRVPKLKGTLAGTRSMATFTPASQLLLKIPKVPTESAIRPGHPVNNWVQNVGDQLSQYKEQQSKTFLPAVAQSVKEDRDQMKDEIMRNKQFSTLNCEPYHREQKTNFGVCKLLYSTADRMNLRSASFFI